MYFVRRFSPEDSIKYASVINTGRQRRFDTSSDQVISVGAFVGGELAGFAVSRRKQEQQFDSAEMLSISVAYNQRRIGIGSALLMHLERELIFAGVQLLEFTLIAENRGADALRALLRKQHWPKPEPCALFASTTHELMVKAPWVQLNLPNAFEVFPWQNLRSNERDTIREQLESGLLPDSLNPLQDFHSACQISGSFGLRHRGQLAGWCLFYPVSTDTITCGALYVNKTSRKQASGVALLAASIRNTAGYKYMFDVSFDNREMLTFLERHLRPYLLSVKTAIRSRKLLGAATLGKAVNVA